METKPSSTGSATCANTMGMSPLARRIDRKAGEKATKIASGAKRANSAA